MGAVRRHLDRRTLLRLAALGLAGAASIRALPALADDDGDERGIPLYIPDDVRSNERWVDVNLTEQAAVAMVGTEPARVALVTTGMDGWNTPEGEYRIQYRVYNETMTSAALGIPPGPDSYYLTGVLFTQYFTNA